MKLRRTAGVVLFVAIAASAARADGDGLQRLVADHRAQWAGSKKEFSRNPAVDNEGRLAVGADAGFSGEFIDASNPASAAQFDRPKLRAALKSLGEWAARERKEADALLERTETALAGAEAWAADPAAFSFEGEDEAAFVFRALADERKKSAVPGLADACAGVFRRWRTLDAWRSLLLRWIEEDCARALAYEAAHPDLPNETSILFVPGGEHIVRVRMDIASLQRLAEDLLRVEPAERAPLKSAPHALPPSLEADWAALLKALENAELRTTLESALDDRWNGAVVAHQLWKYSKAKAVAKLAGVLNAWRRGGGKDVLGMLEVMAYRQGSVFTSVDAGDRFRAEVSEFDAGGTRVQALHRAQAQVQQWNDAWTYGHEETLAECFAKKRADCFNVGTLLACLLANQGVDGLYPVMRVGDYRHVQTALRVDRKLAITDGAVPESGEWPAKYAAEPGTRMGILWMRTVDSWVDAEVVDCGKKVLERRCLPYYGRDEATTEDLK